VPASPDMNPTKRLTGRFKFGPRGYQLMSRARLEQVDEDLDDREVEDSTQRGGSDEAES